VIRALKVGAHSHSVAASRTALYRWHGL